MSIEPAVLVLEQAGVLCTIQDRGRFGYRQDGVPWSGTLNFELATIANRLAGNPAQTPVIEFFSAGPRLFVKGGSARVAVAGACHLTLWRSGKKRICRGWRSVVLHAGDHLEVGPLFHGRVGYLAIAGGLDLHPVLGSCSTWTRGAFGGLDGQPLKRGSLLPLRVTQACSEPNLYLPQPQLPPMPGGRRLHPQDFPPLQIRVVAGPQEDHFTRESLSQFYSGSYEVSQDADRMGMRMLGPALEHCSQQHKDIISEGIIPGCIQVPGHGQPIVMLADCATVGGYPKIATVIRSDLPKLGLLAPGSLVEFVEVSVEQACQLAATANAALEQQLASIRPVPTLAEPFA